MLQLSPAFLPIMWKTGEVLGPEIEDSFPCPPTVSRLDSALFSFCFFPSWAQGSTGWAVPQPDGASGREAWFCCGKDADCSVPNAPGHHTLGLGGHVPRAAYGPSLCGGTPPEVSGLASCFP